MVNERFTERIMTTQISTSFFAFDISSCGNKWNDYIMSPVLNSRYISVGVLILFSNSRLLNMITINCNILLKVHIKFGIQTL